MDRVRQYYAAFREREWDRLERPAEGALELELTNRALKRHLVRPPARVLDLGGGPGRYALTLAEQGYTVSLVDLSPDLLEIARRRAAETHVQIVEIVEGDARDLSRWPAGEFDAVLSLGPFYHLQTPEDRGSAARELKRVLRPGGILFAAFMPRLTFVRRTLALEDERHRLLDRAWLARLLEEGIFDNDIAGRFDHGWGVRAQDVEPFLAEHGFEMIELHSSEGPAPGLQDIVVGLDGAMRDAVLEIIEQLAAEPSILGSANHLLYVGRRT
jgi:ubiquinone/menaquinone biosynthesis C-methylase UbiE